ncbi:hypothetical protein GVAV_003276 [Gurleya vavrai]
MQKEKCIFIFNLPEMDHKEVLTNLYNIHNSTLPIKSFNSILKDDTLIAHLHTKSQINEIIKNVDKKKIKDNTVYAVSFSNLEANFDEEYLPLNKQNLFDIMSNFFNMKNEFYFVCNDNSVSEIENIRTGEIRENFRISGNSFVSSANGLFFAVVRDECVSIYSKDNFHLFNEINITSVKDLYFAGEECYLAIVYKNISDNTAVYNIFSGNKVFEGRLGNNKIKFSKNLEFMIFENSNQIFKNVNLNKKNNEQKIFKNTKDVNFMIQKELFGIEKFESIFEFENIFVFLTGEKLKSVILIKNNIEILRKNYVNLESINFYSEKERLFALINRKAGERDIFSVDTFTPDGKSTINQIEKKVANLYTSNKSFITVSADFEINFYTFKNVSFVLTKKIKKSHKMICCLNKNGNIGVIYDYDEDMIEFYDQGNLINKYPHPGCTDIKWSCSGLYCCSLSSGLGSSGLLQFFDVNGRFLYKKVFNKLSSFEWRRFYINEEMKKKAIKDYANMVEEIENEDEDLKKYYEAQAKENIEERIAAWKDFIIARRNEVLG